MPRKRQTQESGEATSLIDWNEPENGSHLLDWRDRARQFGFMPSEPTDELHPSLPAERLLEEEEPEALDGHRAGSEEDERNCKEPGERYHLTPILLMNQPGGRLPRSEHKIMYSVPWWTSGGKPRQV
mgnify:CR=1 FL=1